MLLACLKAFSGSAQSRIVLSVAVLASFALPVNASPIQIVPPGLNPGDTYRLVFVTDATVNATYTPDDISYYNNIVSAEANSVALLAGLGATWTVIGSSSTVNAVTNIGTTSSEIFTLDGQEVANGTAALFNTYNGPNLLNPIDIDSTGSQLLNASVWTGTYFDGTTLPGMNLGNAQGPIYGFDMATDYRWISFGRVNNEDWHLYAISSELVVGAPEPGSLVMLASGAGLLMLLVRRRAPGTRT